MLTYKSAFAGFCLILQIYAEEVTGETKTPCEAGEGYDCEMSGGVTALQITVSKQKGANLVEESDEDESQSIKDSKFAAVERWQDLMKYELFDADALAKGDLTLSQHDWSQVFSKLDGNKDGKIDATDLIVAETQCANHHWNATQGHYRKAVAIMAESFPEFADFFIEHEDALIFFAETNTSAPKDAPLPSRYSMELFQNNSKKSRLSKKLALVQSDCEQELAMMLITCVGFAMELMGVYLIDSGDIADFPVPPVHLFDAILSGLKDTYIKKFADLMTALGSGEFMQAATIVWEVLYGTFTLGILVDIIKAVYAEMSWYDWASTGLSLIAYVTAQMGTAGAALIASILNAIVQAYNIVSQGHKMITACR